MLHRKFLLLSTALVLGVIGDASAENTGPRTVLDIGCHLHDTTCYVTVSGTAVGPSACRATNIRWSAGLPNGKSVLALLTAAFAAGNSVNITVDDGACFGQAGFPALLYLTVMK